MTSKKWLVMFFATVLGLLLLLMAFNWITDPFGAFGDRVLQWWSYDETNNPRVAKISYLEQHHNEYDSYIIGCSSSSSWSTETLNEYLDANFYNMIMYGADMHDVQLTAKYLADNYEVKNLVLHLYIHNAETYDTEPNNMTYNLHYKVDGSSALAFYTKYLFANPTYGFTKLQNLLNDTYLQQSYDVFEPTSGAYDKSLRDVQPISDLDSYLAEQAYEGFNNYPSLNGHINYIDECMQSVAAIKQICDEKGINLIVVTPPMYYENANYYSYEEFASFNTRLAQITDFWDFTLSSVSFDPRYFYDTTHFRNSVGEMALARMFGNTDVYIPDDFGAYVTADTVDELMNTYQTAAAKDIDEYTAKVPILMYHHLSENEDVTGDTISLSRFTEHLSALREAGYTAVTFEDLYSYVMHGKDLPEKCVVITFDDGYESNLNLAYPVLKEYGHCATVFAIGASEGKDTYKDTGISIYPHFSFADALDCSDAISVQSHSYDMHQSEQLDTPPLRLSAVRLKTESEKDYISALREDIEQFNDLYESVFGTTATVFAYPHGEYDMLSEVILSEYGIHTTLTSEAKSNTLIKGLPNSLHQLGRFTVTADTSTPTLLSWLAK